jgi:DNA-binding LacI/PurR family transcriptional regulator
MLKEKKNITMADVAAHAGVSKSAVSKVLLNGGGKTTKVSEKTAEKIKQAAKKLNYQPNAIARQLKTQKSRIVGAIIHSTAPEIFYELFSHMELELSKLDYCFMVGQARGEIKQIERYLREFKMRGVDAIISELHELPGINNELKKLYSDYDNVIFVGDSIIPNKHCVAPDIKKAMDLIVDYLLKSGRKKIALDIHNLLFASLRLRREGYIEALEKNGIPFDKKICIDKYESDDIEKQIRKLADKAMRNKVDAVIACNDMRAIKLMKEFKRRGIKIPDDIAVTGIDNINIAQLYEPTLTTVDLQMRKIAKACVKLIMDILEKKKAPMQIKVDPVLIKRESA